MSLIALCATLPSEPDVPSPNVILETIRTQCGVDRFRNVLAGHNYDLLLDRYLRCSVTLCYDDNSLAVDMLCGERRSWHFLLDDPNGVEAALLLTKQLLADHG